MNDEDVQKCDDIALRMDELSVEHALPELCTLAEDLTSVVERLQKPELASGGLVGTNIASNPSSTHFYTATSASQGTLPTYRVVI